MRKNFLDKVRKTVSLNKPKKRAFASHDIAKERVMQKPKKSKLSGWQLSTRKNFPDEVRKSFSRQKKCA